MVVLLSSAPVNAQVSCLQPNTYQTFGDPSAVVVSTPLMTPTPSPTPTQSFVSSSLLPLPTPFDTPAPNNEGDADDGPYPTPTPDGDGPQANSPCGAAPQAEGPDYFDSIVKLIDPFWLDLTIPPTNNSWTVSGQIGVREFSTSAFTTTTNVDSAETLYMRETWFCDPALQWRLQTIAWDYKMDYESRNSPGGPPAPGLMPEGSSDTDSNGDDVDDTSPTSISRRNVRYDATIALANGCPQIGARATEETYGQLCEDGRCPTGSRTRAGSINGDLVSFSERNNRSVTDTIFQVFTLQEENRQKFSSKNGTCFLKPQQQIFEDQSTESVQSKTITPGGVTEDTESYDQARTIYGPNGPLYFTSVYATLGHTYNNAGNQETEKASGSVSYSSPLGAFQREYKRTEDYDASTEQLVKLLVKVDGGASQLEFNWEADGTPTGPIYAEDVSDYAQIRTWFEHSEIPLQGSWPSVAATEPPLPPAVP